MRKMALVATLIPTALLIAEPSYAYTRNVTFCNKTAQAVEVAWAYDPTETATTRSEGWRTAQVCQCINLFGEDIRATEFFIYVTRKGSAVGDAISGGRAPLCVRAAQFRFGKSNADAAACANAGGTWVNFQHVDTGSATNYKVNFGSGGNCQD